MLTCVYPAENFKSKAVTVKLRHGKSKRKPKLLSVKEKLPRAKETSGDVDKLQKNQLPVGGGGGAVLVLSELESMAARQQREIAQQRRLLEQREARLAVLRGAQEPAQQDKLARLRHRLDQQQSKLNRLRLLRSQTDQSRANNATLTSDLDCIRALFNEKEKELSLAVAKVEELTRQLEELRGRQNAGGVGSGTGGPGAGGVGAGGPGSNHLQTAASAELEKLKRELMYRNKMNEQQNQVVSQQRLALAQRQAEMASIDARIAQLQGRLQRKRALNQRLSQQLASTNRSNTNSSFAESKLDFIGSQKPRPTGNIAAIEPYSHIPNDNDFNLKKNDPKYQTLPYNTKFTVNFKLAEDDFNKNKIQHSASASQLGQRTFQQFGHQIAHSQSQSHIQGQSQILGANQQQHNHNQSQQSNCNNNNNNNNIINNNNNTSNNNNNNNHANSMNNNLISSQHTNYNQENIPQRIQHHQQQQQQHTNSQQQKQQNSTSSSTSTLGSNTNSGQNQNQRNLQSLQAHQTHQKPVSSVAPSFPVKSPIYQTSSTKIHPVMPQTLSLIGRGHSGSQVYPQSGGQQQSNLMISGQEANYRPNYAVSTIYQSQNPATISTSSNSHTSPSAASGFVLGPPPVQRYNQNQQILNSAISSELQNEKSKSETKQEKLEVLGAGKYEQGRFDGNLYKYEPQVKFDHKFEPTKNEQSNQINKYEIRHDQMNKYEIKHEQINKLEHPVKFENQSNQFKHDQIQNSQSNQFKHDIDRKYEHFKHDKYEGSQQTKEQAKFDVNQKYEQNTVKHDHNVKFEPPTNLPDKPFELDRLKNEADRKNQMEMRVEDKTKPALPPKPIKPNPPPRLTHHEKMEAQNDNGSDKSGISALQRQEKEEEIPPIPTSEPPESPTENQFGNHQSQIIKARPLTLKKAPISEQPKLRYAKSNVHVSINRRIEMPPAFLFPENEIPADLMQTDQQQQQIIESESNNKKVEEDEKEDVDIVDALNVINIEDKPKKSDERKLEELESKASEVIRRKKGNLKSSTGKANLSRRVSFDPLALLLDASLEGELELVKKTAKEVANPSSANDEGITALHNAICAGHLEIVKFLVEFGCDVNAQDSDGWTPLHCAASCNNLSMVRFLVQHGACIFATTLSDHETAAEKCEEDEEGFDGCSEYLYSVQEKLGIMNNGQVFAVFDYEAQHNDELSLKNGDSLVVLRKGDDNEREWWWSKLGHREGYVPRNLLGLYPRVQPSKSD
ncbi:apoptosis-stimulating of p53 protein 2 isoform X2 [Prorops nasuta]|uniref:apoptosis-stimulating of p53 protein 2 isoform X2 n=1 Tax=Prorops nasuta TaxID=863751 RepID=UPI0034CD8EA2